MNETGGTYPLDRLLGNEPPDLSTDAALREFESTPYADRINAVSTLDALRHPEVHFAVVTGKDLRGLTNVINHHGLADLFERNLQTPDTNASKPAPDMVFEAARQAGVDMADVVVVGDTTFDMMMAENAGVTAIGVSYGYHDVTRLQLAGATLIIDSFDQLPQALAKLKPQ